MRPRPTNEQFLPHVRALGACMRPVPRRGGATRGRLRVTYRYYNPTNGRWTRRDPLGEITGLNIYDYVHNRPSKHSDYTGQFIDTIWDVANMVWDAGKLVIGAIIGDAGMRNEGASDFLLDTAAARAKKVTECLGYHTAYHAADQLAGDYSQSTCCSEFIQKLTARATEIRLRRTYLKRGCDYYLPGSVAKTP